ncbi:MAG: DNA polymerase IV [Planctomycetota bacterium]
MIAHVDLDAFYCSVERLLNPELVGKPLIVGGSPDAGGVVSSASYEVRAFGVHSAMPMVRAVQLCPQAVVVSSNFGAYGAYSRQVMDILRSFTPVVDVMSIDEAYLDLAGTERLHGPPWQTAMRIREAVLEQTKLSVSIGLAVNPMLAKIASDLSKPAGMLQVLPGQEEAFLDKLNVGKIPGIGARGRRALASLGVTTVGQLRGLKLPLLKQTFGSWGQKLYEKARGIDHARLGQQSPRKSISKEETFARPRRDRQGLRKVLRGMLNDITRDLRGMDKSARCVTVKLRYTDFDTHTASRTVSEPGNEADDFVNHAIDLFQRLYNRDMGIRLIGVGLSQLQDGLAVQGNLFDDPVQGKKPGSKKLSKVLDQLHDKFGSKALSRGFPRQDTTDERTTKKKPDDSQ